MVETDESGESILTQIAAGDLLYITEKNAARREDPIFDFNS